MRLVLLFALLIVYGLLCMILGASIEKGGTVNRVDAAMEFIGSRLDQSILTELEATMLSGAMAIIKCYFIGEYERDEWFKMLKRNGRHKEESNG